jgi:hypothetical protein
MATGWRNRFKQAFWPLIWLAGLAPISYYAPASYRTLRLANGERVIGFGGSSHELLTVSGPATARPTKPGGHPDFVPTRFKHSMGWVDEIPLGVSIHLWSMDCDLKRNIDLGQSLDIFGVTPSDDGHRIFVEYRLREHQPDWPRDKGCRIAVIDSKTAKSIRVLDSSKVRPLKSISQDGKILVYFETPLRIVCVNVDTGQLLHSVNADEAIVSPDGKYLAIRGYCFWPKGEPVTKDAVVDLENGRRMDSESASWPQMSFSPASDKLMRFYHEGIDIQDIHSNKIISRVPHDSMFVEGGKSIARAVPYRDGMVVKFRAIDNRHDGADRTVSIADCAGNIDVVDAEGNIIQLEGVPTQLTWAQKVLKWLGFGLPSDQAHLWLLIDAKSKQIKARGKGELTAVSADGRYVISRDHDQTRLNVVELPPRPSLAFIIFATLAWTMLLLGGCRGWNRPVELRVEA